jgi:molybdopterin/thiamine biosynthesis adenylyltransferase
MNKERYSRHIILPEIGEEGQQKLLDAKVLVIGAGGLGAPVLQYLVAAGIGRIGMMDADVVSLSNLQRQILYRENEIGESKVEKAKATLAELNSDCQLDSYPYHLTEENANDIISQYDIVVGATDNFASRLLIDKYTKLQGKAFVHASICEFKGQVSVFNYKGGMSYTDLFPDLPDEASMPIGVMGVLPGIIGSMQVAEVIKIIIGQGTVLSGKLLMYDIMKAESLVVDI